MWSIGGALLLLGLAGVCCRLNLQADCPSMAQIHERYDRTERADPARTAAAKLPPGFTKVSAEPVPGEYHDYGRAVQPLGVHSDFEAAAENGKPSNGHALV